METKRYKLMSELYVPQTTIWKKHRKNANFYRTSTTDLIVVPIHLPTLQERIEDIPLLVKDFLEEFCQQNSKAPVSLSPEAIRTLMKYAWPGNVRELKNCIEGTRCDVNRNLSFNQIDLPERILKETGIAFSNLPSVSRRLGTGCSREAALKR